MRTPSELVNDRTATDRPVKAKNGTRQRTATHAGRYRTITGLARTTCKFTYRRYVLFDREAKLNAMDSRSWNSNIGHNTDDTVICDVGAVTQIKAGKCRIACGDLWGGYYVCVLA